MNQYANILGSDNISGGGLGTGDMFNAGNAQIHGLELSLEYDLLHRQNKPHEHRLPISIAYTYTRAQFEETFLNAGGDWGSGQIKRGDRIPFITPHMLTMGIGFEHQRFNVHLLGRYVGDTRTRPGQGALVVPAPSVKYDAVNALKGFLIIDLSANVKCGQYFTAFATVNNLTNNRGIVANLPNGYRPNMPLGFNVGMKAAW